MSGDFLKRLLRPETTLSKLVRRAGRRVAPALPEGLRWRMGLPIMITRDVEAHLRLCQEKIDCAAPDWDQVLAVVGRHVSDRMAGNLRALGSRRVSRQNELKLLTAFMTLQGANPAAQKRYQALLQAFDPALRLPAGLHGMGFTGRGVGTGSLNAYRQVQLDGAQLFEKVYLNSHWELAHMQYAQSHLLPRLGSLRSPTLVHLVPGQRLSVAYFEWADIPARQQRTLRSAANLVQQLQTIDPATLPRPPSTMTDFGVGQLDALMETTPSLLAAMFPAHNPPLDQALPLWRERIAALPRGFSHGDPSIGNVLPNGWVLDWDNCGLFPLGHDAAHYLALRHRQASWDRICQLFNAHFKDPRAPEASWHGFLFFYIHFLNKMPRRHESLFPAAVAALTKAMARG